MKTLFLVFMGVITISGCASSDSEVADERENTPLSSQEKASQAMISEKNTSEDSIETAQLPPLKSLNGANSTKVDTSDWTTYTNKDNGISLRYPSEIITDVSEEKDGGNENQRFVVFSQKTIGGEGFNIISMNSSFPECATPQMQSMSAAMEEPGLASRQFNYVDDEVDGNKVIFHKRNFQSMVGNVFDMFIETPQNTCLYFTSSSDHDMIEAIYRSVKFSK